MSPSHEEFKHKFPVPRNGLSALEGDSSDSGSSDDKDKNELEAQVAEESDKSSQSSMSPQGACSDGGKSSSTLPSTDDPWAVNDPWSVGAKANKVAPPPTPAATRSNPKAKAPPPPPPPMASIWFAKKPDEDDDVQGADVTLNQTPTTAPGLPPPGIAVETGRGMISGSPYIRSQLKPCAEGEEEGRGGGCAGMNSAGYTLNPEKQDCLFFMKTGTCKFATTCRFNHPEGVATVLASESEANVAMPGSKGSGKGFGELKSAGYPLNPGQEDCSFFMRSGACRYAGTCRFNHPEGVATAFAGESEANVAMPGSKGSGKGFGELNSSGYPLNPGQEDCSFFMRAGACKWAGACRYNHPEGVASAFAGDCPYFMRAGACKYAGACRFNHPEGVASAFAGDRGADTDANLRTSSAAPATAAAPAAAPAAAAAASAIAVAVAQAEPPYTRPQREMGRPSASEEIEDLAAELDLAIPGLGEVATKAKVLHFPNSPEYVKKVLAWIAEHELAELEELAEVVENVTGFAGMPELPSKRFLRELRAAVPAVADGR